MDILSRHKKTIVVLGSLLLTSIGVYFIYDELKKYYLEQFDKVFYSGYAIDMQDENDNKEQKGEKQITIEEEGDSEESVYEIKVLG